MSRAPGARPVIALDAMGGDDAPAAIVAGAVAAKAAGFEVILVGDEPRVRACLPAGIDLPIVHAPTVVAMDDKPLAAKRLEDSSIRRTLGLIRAGRAQAAVSCGNSGATLFAAVLELGKAPGVDRPAIATSLPRADGGTLYLCDVGTTTDPEPHHLASFALLGDAYARTMGVARPRVGLLSNGEERGKGNRVVQEAWALLEKLPIHFVGNVEPDDAFRGACDVLVSDGFTGNVLIKTVEGTVAMMKAFAAAKVEGSVRAKAGALLLRPALHALRDELDWRRRGGALLLGVPAPVVVGHGRSDPEAVRAAVGLAHYASEHGLVEAVAKAVSAATESTPSAADAHGTV